MPLSNYGQKSSLVSQKVWGEVYVLPDKQVAMDFNILDENVVWANSAGIWWQVPKINEYYLHRSIDAGETWRSIKLPGLAQMCALDSQIVYINVDSIGILKTIDGGLSWDTICELKKFGPIHFFNQNEGIIICDGTTLDPKSKNDSVEIFLTKDAGKNWEKLDSKKYGGTQEGEGFFSTSFSILFYKGDTVYFGTNYGRILVSYNKGSDWSIINSPLGKKDIVENIIIKDDFIVFLSIGTTKGINSYTFRAYPVLVFSEDAGKSWQYDSCISLSITSLISEIPGTNDYMIASYFYGIDPGGTMIVENLNNKPKLIDEINNIVVAKFLNNKIGYAGNFDFNEILIRKTYIMKWLPGDYPELSPSRLNKNLPAKCITPDTTKIMSQNSSLLNVHPNPSSGLINIDLPSASTNQSYVTIFDYTGRQIIKQSIPIKKAGEEISINISDKAQGIYYVEIEIGSSRYYSKVLLIK